MMGHRHLPEWLDTWMVNATFDKKQGLHWKLPRGRKLPCLWMLILTHTAQSWMRSLGVAAATDFAMADHDVLWTSLRIGSGASRARRFTLSACDSLAEHERAHQ